MFLKILGVIFFVVAGFFIYMSCLINVINVPEANVTVMASIFLIPAAVALLLGHASMGFKNWVRNTGTVFVSGGGFTALLFIMLICINYDEAMRAQMPPEWDTIFNANFFTVLPTAVFVLTGVGQIFFAAKDKKKAAAAQA